MNSIEIRDRLCPRCEIRRTGRIGRGDELYCFNCRLRWRAEEVTDDVAANVATCQFSATERARLEAYRTAVDSGLYTEWERGDA
ncbi:MAG TPA: hypothetical protein VH916_10550 [Dehalococcoidia bacterium]|jgi:hypothetical protein